MTDADRMLLLRAEREIRMIRTIVENSDLPELAGHRIGLALAVIAAALDFTGTTSSSARRAAA